MKNYLPVSLFVILQNTIVCKKNCGWKQEAFVVGTRFIAGIDAGGTTFKLGVSNTSGVLLEKERIPTTTPGETLAQSVRVLRKMERSHNGRIELLGIASFGPVDVDQRSSNYGTILNTPKAGWTGVRIRRELEAALGVPVVLDTDVNAALLAETAQGAAVGVRRSAYITIGTGVGVGVSVDGKLAGRPFHPELGHIRVERHANDKNFGGCCAVHGACLEGMLSAPALIKRFGALEVLPDDSPCWDVASWYLAQLCLALMLTFRLERIVIGGGVMNTPSLIAKTRSRYIGFLGTYLQAEERRASSVLVKAGLGEDAGLLGAIELVRRNTIEPDEQ